jgi:hypothetical protein
VEKVNSGHSAFVTGASLSLAARAVPTSFHPLEWMEIWPPAGQGSRLVLIGRDPGAAAERFESRCV